jgi:hypothetical protein
VKPSGTTPNLVGTTQEAKPYDLPPPMQQSGWITSQPAGAPLMGTMPMQPTGYGYPAAYDIDAQGHPVALASGPIRYDQFVSGGGTIRGSSY